MTAKGLKDKNGNKIVFDYESLENKPTINGKVVSGDLELLTEADAELSENSTNPVQNKAVASAVYALQAAQNLLDIVANYESLRNYQYTHLVRPNDKIKVLNDENYEGQASYYRWDGESWQFLALEPVPKIEVDTEVTEDSDKLITSGAVKEYVDTKIQEEIEKSINEALTADYTIGG